MNVATSPARINSCRMMRLRPSLLVFLYFHTLEFASSSHASKAWRLAAPQPSLLLQRRGTKEELQSAENVHKSGGLRKTISQRTLLDPSGNPAAEPQDTIDGASRVHALWRTLWGSNRSDATQRSRGHSMSSGSSSRHTKSTNPVVGGSSPRSSVGGEPWSRPPRIEEEDEGPSQAWRDKQNERVKAYFKKHFGVGKQHDPVNQVVPPDFAVDEKKMFAEHPPTPEQLRKSAAAKRMSYEQKEVAVRNQHMHVSRSLVYLLTVGFGDARLEEPKSGECHVIKLTRDPGVVVPDSNEGRTHVLAAGRLLGAGKKPQTWEATAFYMKILKSGIGYRHVAVPFRPEEFPRDLFIPEYMGPGAHPNVDYHQQSVEGGS